jgi:lipopolysaccharide export system permease protein
MFLLPRYIIREHIGPFLFAFSIIASMLVLNFVLQAMRYIIGKGIGLQIILEYIAYNLAWIIVLVVPMSILVATIMAFGRLASDNEITAIKAGGVHFYALIVPVLLVASLVTYGLIRFNDDVLPAANHKARVLKKNIQSKRPTLSIEPGVFLDGIENFSLLIENKDELGSGIYGITIFDKSDRSSLRTITAERGTLEMEEVREAMILTLENGEIHELNVRRINAYERVRFRRHRVIVPVENMTLKKSDETYYNEREKTIDQLIEEVRRHRSEQTVQLGRAVRALNEEPSLMGSLDTKQQRAVSRFLLGGSLFDRISDYFVTLHMPADPRTDTIPLTLSEQAVSLYAHVRGDSMLADSIKRASAVAAPISKEIGRPDTTAARNRAASTQQVTSGLTTALTYQRMIDQLMVEVNKKYSIPFACVVFVLIGAPIGVKARRGNLGIAGGISLFFFIAYYFCLVLGEDYADRQLLNPFFAMWFPNIALGIVGMMLTWQTASETTLRLGLAERIGGLFRRLRTPSENKA